MSAPDTNVERQAKNHRGPLVGIILAVCVATAGFLALLFYTSDRGASPTEPTAATIESTTPTVDNATTLPDASEGSTPAPVE